MTKTYVGICRDHSGSMQGLRHAALKDYNQNIATIKEESIKNEQDTIVSTVLCGVNRGIEREIVNSNVHTLKPLDHYRTEGMTPLFDGIGDLIEIFEDVPDANKSDVAFLIMVITDGAENASYRWKTKLKGKIQELQKTDRWSFVFRVPRGYGSNLTALGIPSGNIVEWDQNEESLIQTSFQTSASLSSYYGMRSKGVTSTRTFYTDMSKVTPQEIKANLKDISSEVKILAVSATKHDWLIGDFVFDALKHPLIKGCAFYELTKPERDIQDYKKLVIQDKNNGKVYGGSAARKMLGFPEFGSIKVAPGDHGNWKIFVQSTSTNRKLKMGTSLLYWANAV